MLSNLRLAFRMLLRTPGLTAIAILSLAIGIGANTAIFSLYNQMLRRPLPVHDPYALVNLAAPGPKPGSQSSNQAGSTDSVFSYLMFRDLEKAKGRFSGVAAHRLVETNLGFKGQTTAGQGVLVSGSYFDVLGLKPAAGRLLGAIPRVTLLAALGNVSSNTAELTVVEPPATIPVEVVTETLRLTAGSRRPRSTISLLFLDEASRPARPVAGCSSATRRCSAARGSTPAP